MSIEGCVCVCVCVCAYGSQNLFAGHLSSICFGELLRPARPKPMAVAALALLENPKDGWKSVRALAQNLVNFLGFKFWSYRKHTWIFAIFSLRKHYQILCVVFGKSIGFRSWQSFLGFRPSSTLKLKESKRYFFSFP